MQATTKTEVKRILSLPEADQDAALAALSATLPLDEKAEVACFTTSHKSDFKICKATAQRLAPKIDPSSQAQKDCFSTASTEPLVCLDQVIAGSPATPAKPKPASPELLKAKAELGFFLADYLRGMSTSSELQTKEAQIRIQSKLAELVKSVTDVTEQEDLKSQLTTILTFAKDFKDRSSSFEWLWPTTVFTALSYFDLPLPALFPFWPDYLKADQLSEAELNSRLIPMGIGRGISLVPKLQGLNDNTANLITDDDQQKGLLSLSLKLLGTLPYESNVSALSHLSTRYLDYTGNKYWSGYMLATSALQLLMTGGLVTDRTQTIAEIDAQSRLPEIPDREVIKRFWLESNGHCSTDNGAEICDDYQMTIDDMEAAEKLYADKHPSAPTTSSRSAMDNLVTAADEAQLHFQLLPRLADESLILNTTFMNMGQKLGFDPKVAGALGGLLSGGLVLLGTSLTPVPTQIVATASESEVYKDVKPTNVSAEQMSAARGDAVLSSLLWSGLGVAQSYVARQWDKAGTPYDPDFGYAFSSKNKSLAYGWAPKLEGSLLNNLPGSSLNGVAALTVGAFDSLDSIGSGYNDAYLLDQRFLKADATEWEKKQFAMVMAQGLVGEAYRILQLVEARALAKTDDVKTDLSLMYGAHLLSYGLGWGAYYLLGKGDNDFDGIFGKGRINLSLTPIITPVGNVGATGSISGTF